MKKVLLLAAVFMSSVSLLTAQSLPFNKARTNPLLSTDVELFESKVKTNAMKGGAVADYYSFYDLAIQWASQSNYSNFVAPMMPDTTTTLFWYDGSQLDLGPYGVMGAGALYDFSLEFWDEPFADEDQVTVDSIFVGGFYEINDNTQSDTLRLHIFKADTNNASSGIYGGIYFPAGTFTNVSNDATQWTMDYVGNSAQGNKGYIDVPNTTVVDYIFQTADSAKSVHGIEIPNGFTLDADETFGFYVEFIPGGYGFNDTINLQTLSGTTNFFSLYFASDQSSPLTGEFQTYSSSTHMNSSLFAYAETRYGSWPSAQSFLNDYLLPSSRRLSYFAVHASGTSSVDLDENNLGKAAVFPNPSNGVINVELNTDAEATVTVVDVLGQVVYRSNENFVAGERKMINLSSKAKGMYILTVEGEGVNTVERISIK
ncbi:T9SS type A sorting domain-containing protein [Schleiferiaceae bacterium]|nr:T9SS type A sorting domain-containing protein [Schleiferiaceae bacterium]